ncbi:hypothetical protein E2C00_00340 [Streptomyces sp. WAC05374]|uniref:hypothetical protein n=1 Tax=Streptomyces sp. WAC05374 TaxID=2487420 RepID=UPI000F86531F|nr:hypothetical protein [Streptomyces sp. WAC05374]RST19627.1 hypothetical protein EF905_00605 [Streptomyces sp. WAC05374]TDF50036.1 hypothetical protein E2B92_00315 [Streptomyces sp. WAC05374]TDF57762.1 hypothetical protein E2C02_08105 [Streptomyces sp. WAC05374]TDF60290.1 hypothetical protein E2C00_00340 [Streptomyces sp. WAC05374]
MRNRRHLPLRERLLRRAALTDRSTLDASAEDGKVVQMITNAAFDLADHDREHSTATGPVRPDSLTTNSTLPHLCAYIRQEYAAHRHAPARQNGGKCEPRRPRAGRGEPVASAGRVPARRRRRPRPVVRELPQDWPQRELGLFRPEAALDLASSEELRTPVEIEPYDTDWENCGACSEASDPCRFHTRFETGYKALHQVLLDAIALDQAVTGRPPCSSGWPTTTRTTASRSGPRTPTPRRCRDDGDQGLPDHPGSRPRPRHATVCGRPGGLGQVAYAQTAAVDAVICLDSCGASSGDAGDQPVTPAAILQLTIVKSAAQSLGLHPGGAGKTTMSWTPDSRDTVVEQPT